MKKRVKTALKELFTKNKKLKLAYLCIVIFLFYAPSMCSHTKITTPAQDAYKLYQMAQCFETEAELRSIEKLCNEMEIAYQNSYNGAVAMKFRLMTQSIIDEASKRREGFRAMEEAEANAELTLANLFADLDAAWQINIPSEEEAQKQYDKLTQICVDTHMAMRAKLIESGKIYEEAQKNNYRQDILNKHTAVVNEFKALEQQVIKHNATARHYNLAYRLKFGKEFPKSTLLNKYIAAFDGRYTRINAGVAYGDAEYIIELVGMAESFNDMDRIQYDIVDVIVAKYQEDYPNEGYDGMLTLKIQDAIDEAYTRIENDMTFKLLQSDMDYIIEALDAKWCTDENTECETPADAPVEAVECAECETPTEAPAEAVAVECAECKAPAEATAEAVAVECEAPAEATVEAVAVECAECETPTEAPVEAVECTECEAPAEAVAVECAECEATAEATAEAPVETATESPAEAPAEAVECAECEATVAE